MAEITLRQLRYVEALVAQGHFGRAAAVCAISQPALSARIRELEATLGAPLFERTPKGVRPTRLGEAFAARVRPILRRVDDLADLARADAARLGGRLRLGVIPTVAPYLLPAVLRALADAAPGLEVSVRETVTARLLAELGDGGLDAALVALPSGDAGLAGMPLVAERFVLARPAAERGEPVPPAEALADRLLLLEEGHCFRDQALAVCGLRRAAPALDGSSLATLVQMVGAGLGVTLIPEMAVPVEGRWASVDVVPLPGAQPAREVGLVWRRTSPLDARLRELGEVIRRAAVPPAPEPR